MTTRLVQIDTSGYERAVPVADAGCVLEGDSTEPACRNRAGKCWNNSGELYLLNTFYVKCRHIDNPEVRASAGLAKDSHRKAVKASLCKMVDDYENARG
jgi:hypothetical protein